MIKTKRGYHSITNGITTWCFYEQAVASVLSAYIDGDVDKLTDLCILIINNLTGVSDYSKWPHTVTNEFELGNQIIRDKHRAERGKDKL